MKFVDIISGKVFENEIITKRLPLFFLIFFIILAYIGIGYIMQNYMQQEKKLYNDYQELQGTSVILHERMVHETDLDNLKFLISKYNLNIEPQTISPFVIEK